jgi:hypothetical protein
VGAVGDIPVTTELFNVVVFDAEGFSTYVVRDHEAKEAVEEAHRQVMLALDGAGIDKVMITDDDDFANFLWERGKEIVYPPCEVEP